MNRSQTRRVASGVAIIATLALGLAACGGDDDDTDTTTAPTESEVTTAGTDAETATTLDDTATTLDDDDASTTTPGTEDGGDDGETYEADAYVDAVVEEIDLEDTETATCVAEAVVDAIGVERIEASGVVPEDFADAPSLDEVDLAIDEANADAMQDDLESCGDLVEMFVSANDISDVQRDCARDHLTTPLVAELFVAQFVGIAPSTEATDATAALQACAAED